MADDALSTAGLLLAITSDEEKAKRLEELHAAQQEAVAARAALDQRVREIDAAREQAQVDREKAEAAQRDVAVREAKLALDTDALRSALDTHHRDVAAYSAIREKIDAEQQQREEWLAGRQRELDEAVARNQTHEATLTSREAEVSEREAAMKRKHEALAKAMAV